MIKAVFCDTGALLPDRAEEIAADLSRLKALRDRRGEARRCESLGGYILLDHLLKESGVGEDDGIIFDAPGKPHLSSGSLHLSLSHREGVSFAVISDSFVGCDVECMDNPERIERVRKKFLDGIDFSGLRSFDVDVCFARLSSDGSLEYLSIITDNENNDLHLERIYPDSTAYSEWTVLEAALKCEGGGFSSLSRADALIRRYSIGCAELSYGGRKYSLAVAKT